MGPTGEGLRGGTFYDRFPRAAGNPEMSYSAQTDALKRIAKKIDLMRLEKRLRKAGLLQ